MDKIKTSAEAMENHAFMQAGEELPPYTETQKCRVLTDCKDYIAGIEQRWQNCEIRMLPLYQIQMVDEIVWCDTFVTRHDNETWTKHLASKLGKEVLTYDEIFRTTL